MSVESNPRLNWFCFTVLFDWSRKLAPPSQPIRCKLKPIAPWSLAFSRATGRLHAFTSSCHWLPLIISFTLIGRCDYFGFGFRHSIEKRSKRVWKSVIKFVKGPKGLADEFYSFINSRKRSILDIESYLKDRAFTAASTYKHLFPPGTPLLKSVQLSPIRYY